MNENLDGAASPLKEIQINKAKTKLMDSCFKLKLPIELD